MRTRFHGWPEQAYAVLLQLEGEPSPETRERIRRHREEQVRQPMIGLLKHRSLIAARQLEPDAVRGVEPVHRAL